MPSPWQDRPFGETVRGVTLDQSDRLYVPLYGEQPVTSDDGGLTWQKPGNVFYPGGDMVGSVPFAVSIGTSPNVAGLAYAWIQTRAGRGAQVGARSLDGGVTWQVVEHLCLVDWILVT
ncbi:MAG: sialidase family protein, partial [Nitrospira sp.]